MRGCAAPVPSCRVTATEELVDGSATEETKPEPPRTRQQPKKQTREQRRRAQGKPKPDAGQAPGAENEEGNPA